MNFASPLPLFRLLLVIAAASALTACSGSSSADTSRSDNPDIASVFPAKDPDENPSWKNDNASNYPKIYDSENPQPNSLNNP